MFLQDNIECGLNIDDIVLTLLLFADDIAILAKTPEDLQTSLDLLHTYCSNWSLEVNTTKTKIMVFRKRRDLLRNERWMYNGVAIEVVDSLKYLGTVISFKVLQTDFECSFQHMYFWCIREARSLPFIHHTLC